jgi:hypothetical protein
LAELTRRYFASRGPATLHDFVTWSGLTVKDARAGMATLPSTFLRETMGDRQYIFIPPVGKPGNPVTTFLMPDYDEYGMGYKDRSAIFDSGGLAKSVSRGNPVFNRMTIIDGRIAGTWRRTIKKNAVIVETVPFAPLGKAKQLAVMKAVKKFRQFAGGESNEGLPAETRRKRKKKMKAST